MKDLFTVSFNKVFVGALLLLIVINIIGATSEDALFLQATKPLFVPIFFIFLWVKNKTIKIPFLLCLLYSFLGDSASMFFANDTFLKASSVMYFLSYLCLIGFMVPKFKFLAFNRVIAIYLVVVALINMYFLFTICSVLKVVVPDGLEVFLFGLKSVTVIVLLFVSFGIYLISESRMSILFLLMAVSFVFSDTLDYVSQYYVYDWSFLMLDRVLHAVGLFFLFSYIVEYNKSLKKNDVKEPKVSAANILV